MALLEAEDGSLVKLNVRTSAVREGDLVTVQDGVLVPDADATQQRKEELRAHFNRLKAD